MNSSVRGHACSVARHVGAVAIRLCAQEAVAGAVEDMRLVRLAGGSSSAVSVGATVDVDPGIVAAIEPEDRRVRTRRTWTRQARSRSRRRPRRAPAATRHSGSWCRHPSRIPPLRSSRSPTAAPAPTRGRRSASRSTSPGVSSRTSFTTSSRVATESVPPPLGPRPGNQIRCDGDEALGARADRPRPRIQSDRPKISWMTMTTGALSLRSG